MKKNTFLNKMKDRTLENITLQMFNKSFWGRILNFAYILIGLISVFVYKGKFQINIVLCIILGFITWFIIGIIVDFFVKKFYRIDKQLDWLLNTPAGAEEIKRKGLTEAQIQELKELSNHILD